MGLSFDEFKQVLYQEVPGTIKQELDRVFSILGTGILGVGYEHTNPYKFGSKFFIIHRFYFKGVPVIELKTVHFLGENGNEIDVKYEMTVKDDSYLRNLSGLKATNEKIPHLRLIK